MNSKEDNTNHKEILKMSEIMHKKASLLRKPGFPNMKNNFDSSDYFDDQKPSEGLFIKTSPSGLSSNPFFYKDDEAIIHLDKTPLASQKDDPEDIFQVSLQLKKKVIQASSFGVQAFPMLVSLLAESGKARPPIDLVCVIDRSRSMRGEKMNLVKKTFDYLLRYLEDFDRLSIVFFDDNVQRLLPLSKTSNPRKKEILGYIKDIYAKGGTDISLGMAHAFEILKQRRYRNPVSSIFLLSDGKDKKPPHKVLSSLGVFTSSQDSQDISIHTFGFGQDHDPKLMNDIADLKDGNFYYVKELDTLDKAFVDCLGGLVSSVAQSVEIKIQPEQSLALQGVEIQKAYGDASMWTKKGQAYTTKMLSLISGRKKDFVLEIKIPTTTKELNDNEKNVKIVSVEVQIVDLANKHITKKADLYVTLLNEDEEVKDDEEEEADKEVMTNFFRVKGASLMTKARELAERKQYEEAKKILKNFKEELENSFLKEEVFIKNLIQDMKKAILYTSPQEYVKTGNRALLSNARAQVRQKTCFDSANYFQNNVQSEMLEQLESIKNK